MLTTDINSRIDPIKPEETQRQSLTIEELKKLDMTDCTQPVLKKAALFSAITGLRFSDIQKLTWGEIEETSSSGVKQYTLHFRQKKTKGVEILPISERAFSLLGDRQHHSSKVFKNLKYSAYQNIHLKQWVLAAGIHKKITFHNFRHTFAMLQLDMGTDILTIRDMLGHRALKTTMVYAKSGNLAKKIAANKINF